MSGPRWAGAAGKRRKVSGPGCWAAGKKKKKKLGWADAETKEVRAGLFSGLGWIAKGFGFPFSILFLIQTKFEIKNKFEFKPHSIN